MRICYDAAIQVCSWPEHNNRQEGPCLSKSIDFLRFHCVKRRPLGIAVTVVLCGYNSEHENSIMLCIRFPRHYADEIATVQGKHIPSCRCAGCEDSAQHMRKALNLLIQV